MLAALEVGRGPASRPPKEAGRPLATTRASRRRGPAGKWFLRRDALASSALYPDL